MKNIFKSTALAVLAMCSVSCYEDYLNDFEAPSMGFSYPRQVRTIVSDNATSYVGVAIGGKRELSLNEWACFVIDESLLNGLPYKLLPGEYYTLSDDNVMRARRKNVFTADVGVTFNDRFFEDPAALKNTYALPLRIVRTSLADVPDVEGNLNPEGAIMEGKETVVIVFKYISAYAGTYYRIGSEVEIDETGTIVGEPVWYKHGDLVNNRTVTVKTLSKNGISLTGIGASDKGNLSLFITEVEGAKAYNVRMETDSSIELTDYTSRWIPEGDYTFFSGDEYAPQFELEYTYRSGDKYFKVSEKLVLRQRPAKDLRLETF